MPHDDAIAGHERLAPNDTVLVDVDAIRAAQILDHDAIGGDQNARVPARYETVVEHHVTGGTPTHEEGTGPKLETLRTILEPKSHLISGPRDARALPPGSEGSA